MLFTIVSGGQTGIDRMALDVAIDLSVNHGGCCPKGRRAEDGVIPKQYQLRETASRNYAHRTKQNIIDSDGTLVLYGKGISGGTELTIKLCKRLHKPVLVFGIEDLQNQLISIEDRTVEWLKQNQIKILNVAGPRESTQPELSEKVKKYFQDVVRNYIAILNPAL